MQLRVRYSPIAQGQFAELKEAKPGSARATVYKGFKHMIEKVVSESQLALLPQHRLSADLSGILRLKKGRMRLFFIASEAKQAATILMIGNSLRKDGDRDDPYEEIKRYLRRGYFDACFEELGLAKPQV